MPIGANRKSPLDVVMNIFDHFNKRPVSEWAAGYKENMKQLSASGFSRFKMRGVRVGKKDVHIVSRGYLKLQELLNMTKIKPRGVILSLCSGRGGWEQLIAGYSQVERITAVTLGSGPGHEGHENVPSVFYPGKSKVRNVYADARTYPVTAHDTLFFDGGESHGDAWKEASRFNDLFEQVVMRQINSATREFVLKVLTPTDENTLEKLKRIQEITGKGNLFRCSLSRVSTLELYFVSTKKGCLDTARKELLKSVMYRAIENTKLERRVARADYKYAREEIIPGKVEILEPLDMAESVREMGEPVPEQGRDYNHWEGMGVFPVGTEGSTGMKYNKYAIGTIKGAIGTLEGFDSWRLTDTTPEGFTEVFKRKVDVSPMENSVHNDVIADCYSGLAKFFRQQSFVLKEMTWEEVEKEANKQGAPGYNDKFDNVGDFLKDPNWRKKIETVRRSLLNGKPIGAIFNTMGKREKKEVHGKTGSRMVAFLNIATRLLELKLFGNVLKLTKPVNNRFGVGGLGLHDIGMRISEVWLGAGVSNDIAGFDTRIGLNVLSNEARFIAMLGGNESHKAMYRLYAHPAILIPIPSTFRRSELLFGRGQRMSGTNPTYSMNTITRLVIFLAELAVKFNIKDVEGWVLAMMKGKQVHEGVDTKAIAGVISGDDAAFFSSKYIDYLASTGEILEQLGFPRKGMQPKQRSPVANTIEEVEFCSHHYERVTYYDVNSGRTAARYMPTRDVVEIIAKASYRVGGQDRELDDLGWISAQANNLLVNYAHMRTVRAIGMAFKAIAPPGVILGDKGGFLRPKPWMQPGDILEVTNEVLFGASTKYPVPNFKVRSWRHVGYLPPKHEICYDRQTYSKVRTMWRKHLRSNVANIIYEMKTGGNLEVMDNWRGVDLD